MIAVESLKKMTFLKEASDASLNRLAQDMVEKRYQPEELILREGEHSDAIYIIMEGVARVEKKLDEIGRSKVVARLEKEEIFGEMSFLERKPLSASVVADTSLLVYVLQRSALEKLGKTDSSAALDQILTIFSGMSRRLRRTTTELVTVFEVARLLMQDNSFDEILKSVLNQLTASLGESVPVAFYRWNPFNDEYDMVFSLHGTFPSNFGKAIDQKNDAFNLKSIQFGKNYEGLLAFSTKTVFDSGAQQMIDTVSGLLAPALASWRLREEDEARTRFEKSRQEKFYS